MVFGSLNNKLIPLDSKEAERVDKNDFEDFLNVLEKAVKAWKTGE